MTAFSSTRLRNPALIGVLALALAPAGISLFAADIKHYGVSKGILFSQTNAASPVIRDGLPYVFQAIVAPPTNAIISARVQWSLIDLPMSPITTPQALGFVQRVRDQDTLDVTFPNGAFRIVTQTQNDGIHMGDLSVVGNRYPSPPVILDYAATQEINVAEPFTLKWSRFVNATTNDFIFVQIESSRGREFATGMFPGAPDALDGTATSVLIPDQTLQPGRAYAARVAFYRLSYLDSTNYPGVLGTGGYFTQTDFYVTTRGSGDTTPPELLTVSPTNRAIDVPINAPVVFQFTEPMNRGFAFALSGTTARRIFEWSPDSRTLVATPVTNWPANTTIAWTLNPFYTLLAFGDASANPLPMETIVTFTTGSELESNSPPVLSDQRQLPNGRFQFLVSGLSNRAYTIEASTNLVDWNSLATNVAFTGQMEFLDTTAPAFPWRFYRAFGR